MKAAAQTPLPLREREGPAAGGRVRGRGLAVGMQFEGSPPHPARAFVAAHLLPRGEKEFLRKQA